MIKKKLIFIPGFRKSGTSTLYEALSQHSQISTPTMKEPQFFALKETIVKDNIEWYQRLYKSEKRYLLDASTLCFPCKKLSELLKEQFEEVKVLMVIRDPAKRAFSSFLHYKKQIPSADTRNFDDILDEMESLLKTKNLEQAETAAMERALQNKQVISNYYKSNYHQVHFNAKFKSEFSEDLVVYKYFLESRYSKYMKNYEKSLKKDFKIIIFEELLCDFDKTLGSIFEFLGIEKEAVTKTHQNNTLLPKSTFSRKILKFIQNNLILKKIKLVLKKIGAQKYGRNLKNIIFYHKKPKMTLEQYKRARNILDKEYQYWFNKNPQIYNYWKY